MQGVGDGLVVLVDEQDGAPAGASVQGEDQIFEAGSVCSVAALAAVFGLQAKEPVTDVGVQTPVEGDVDGGEFEQQHRALDGPVPLVVGR